MIKNNFLKYLTIPIVLAAFLHLYPLGIPCAVFGKSDESQDPVIELEKELSQKKQKIDLLDKKEKGLLEQFTELEKEVSLRKELVSQFGSKIKNAQSRIKIFNNELQDIEKSLRKAQVRMAKRLSVLYKYATRGYIKLLANARDFRQFRQRMKYVRVILENDHKMLMGLYEEQRKGMEKIASVKDELSSQENQKDKMAQKLSFLREDLDKKVVQLMKIHKDKEFYEMAVRELEFAAQRMKETLDDIEKRETEKEPLPGNFAGMKGKLPYPIKGKIVKAEDFQGPKNTANNKGIFIQSDKDSQVKAIFPGRVDFSGILRGYGQIVIINHGSRFFTISGHLSGRNKEKGESVKKDEIIGTIRTSGHSGGARLYFEIRKGAKTLDPLAWLGRQTG